jgi:hypothetical protein
LAKETIVRSKGTAPFYWQWLEIQEKALYRLDDPPLRGHTDRSQWRIEECREDWESGQRYCCWLVVIPSCGQDGDMIRYPIFVSAAKRGAQRELDRLRAAVKA